MSIVHHVLTNPTTEKINDLNIQGPYFIYSVYNSPVNDDLGITTFNSGSQTYYYFTNRIRKTVIYMPEQIPTNFDNINTIFITEIMRM